jgi:hypothetical protein
MLLFFLKALIKAQNIREFRLEPEKVSSRFNHGKSSSSQTEKKVHV